MIIVLVGYMASGKTSVGNALARVLNYRFKDLDHHIESVEKMTISELFSEKGEVYFRKLETAQLKILLKEENQLILALGGGTPCYGQNSELLQSNEKVVTIYLKASIDTLTARLASENQTRPLVAHLKKEDDLKEFIGKHLFERIPFYSKSDFTVETDDRSVDAIVHQILLNLF